MAEKVSAARTSPFITATDVLQSLNANIAQLTGADGDDDGARGRSGGFELQRRMPDGSARPATRKELRASDFETKLRQAAGMVDGLPGPERRLEWAERQRLAGNALYAGGRYEEAVDVYLTCLVVAQPKWNRPTGDEGRQEESEEVVEDEEHEYERQRIVLFCKVMNNLAQSTMQLGWHHKTVQFTTLALDHLLTKSRSIIGDDDSAYCEQLSKLHFKRGKAERLRGHYVSARSDLDQAAQWLRKRQHLLQGSDDDDDDDGGTTTTTTTARMIRIVERELLLVDRQQAEGKRNQQRQKQAMQRVLGKTKETETTEEKTSDAATATTTKKSFRRGLSEPVEADNPLYRNELRRRRTHSTLRARRPGCDPPSQQGEAIPLSYRHYYWNAVARGAEKVLEWMGEEEAAAEYHAKRE
jgi:tetratricopeptide (TPR) repeat protein